MMKQLIHNVLRRFGVDVFKIANLRQELERLERARNKEQLREFERLRALSKQVVARQRGEVLWVSREKLMPEATVRMDQVATVLDIGCAFRPQQYIIAKSHICCEPCGEYMERLIVETSTDARFVYIGADAHTVSELLPARSVDTAFMADVIEHIDKKVGLEIIERLKAIVRRQIILFTPLGYMDQEPNSDGCDQWGMQGAEWQKHRSGWMPEDFSLDDGWTVIACRDFHQVDGYGRQLGKPVGAFWAIWSHCCDS